MRAKAWRMLFAGRRWMLWLPVPASVWLALPEWQHIPAMLFGGLIVWIPFWLAWWLSDGFAGMSRWPGTGAPAVSGGVNPLSFSEGDCTSSLGWPPCVHRTSDRERSEVLCTKRRERSELLRTLVHGATKPEPPKIPAINRQAA